MSVLQNLLGVVFLAVSLVARGYVESTSKGLGWTVSVAIAAYFLFLSRKNMVVRILAAAFVVVEIYLCMSDRAQLAFIASSFLCCLHLIPSSTSTSSSRDKDTKVEGLKPIEREIRALVSRYDPSSLSKVDTMLAKQKGREEQCYKELRAMYQSAPSPAPRHLSDARAEEVRDFFYRHSQSPEKEKAKIVERMLADYRGHEDQLLAELQEEFRPPAPPASKPWSLFGATDKQLLDQARRDAKAEIEKRTKILADKVRNR